MDKSRFISFAQVAVRKKASSNSFSTFQQNFKGFSENFKENDYEIYKNNPFNSTSIEWK